MMSRRKRTDFVLDAKQPGNERLQMWRKRKKQAGLLLCINYRRVRTRVEQFGMQRSGLCV
jgi:hypothetical protein